MRHGFSSRRNNSNTDDTDLTDKSGFSRFRVDLLFFLAVVGVPAIAVRLSTIGYSRSAAVIFVALKQTKKHKPQRGDNDNKNITAPLGLAL